MGNTPNTYPGRGRSLARTGGTHSWSNPSRITENDGSYAHATIRWLTDLTHWLTGDQVGFTDHQIPDGVTLTGIRHQEIKNRRFASQDIRDCVVQLLDEEGNPVGDNKAQNVNWGRTRTTYTYGGSSDLWNWSGVTPAKLRSDAFGAHLSAKVVVEYSTSQLNARVYQFRFTVYYTGAIKPAVAETLALAEDAFPTINLVHAVTDSIQLADSILSYLFVIRSLTDGLHLVDEPLPVPGLSIALQDTLALADQLQRALDYVRHVADVAQLTDDIHRTAGLIRTAHDIAALQDLPQPVPGLCVALEDTLAILETLPHRLHLVRTAGDALVLEDAIRACRVIIPVLTDLLHLVEFIHDQAYPYPGIPTEPGIAVSARAHGLRAAGDDYTIRTRQP